MQVINELDNFDSLLSDLRAKDKGYARISKTLQYVYFLLALAYALAAIIGFVHTGDFVQVIKPFSFFASFFSFAVLFTRYTKEYGKVDYSLPTILMLKKAVYRYSPFRKDTVLALIPLFFFDIAFSNPSPLGLSFFHGQILFLAIILISMIIGLVVWYIQYKPIRDRALALIADIEA